MCLPALDLCYVIFSNLHTVDIYNSLDFNIGSLPDHFGTAIVDSIAFTIYMYFVPYECIRLVSKIYWH